MHCVKCSVSFHVDIFVLATKDYNTFIFMVKIYSCKPIRAKNNASKLDEFLQQLYYSQIGFIVLVPDAESLQ